MSLRTPKFLPANTISPQDNVIGPSLPHLVRNLFVRASFCSIFMSSPCTLRFGVQIVAEYHTLLGVELHAVHLLSPSASVMYPFIAAILHVCNLLNVPSSHLPLLFPPTLRFLLHFLFLSLFAISTPAYSCNPLPFRISNPILWGFLTSISVTTTPFFFYSFI